MTTINIFDMDAAWNPNPNGEWADPRGRAAGINAIASDSDPRTLRNVAIYYRRKGAEWAANMARMLERMAEGPANDNKPVAKQAGKPRNRRAA